MYVDKLSEEVWKGCVKNNPIFAMDIILFNPKKGILTGKRLNQPAKNKYFVPGGRVFKNESRKKAFERISKIELGKLIKFEDSKLINIFEHFYKNSRWEDENFGTHYIVEARYIIVDTKFETSINLNNQHSELLWIDYNFSNKSIVHNYCYAYLDHFTFNSNK